MIQLITSKVLIDSGTKHHNCMHGRTTLLKKIKGTLWKNIRSQWEKYLAGYLYWYGQGNVLGMTECHIVWWKWKLWTYREGWIKRHPKNQSEKIMQQASSFCWTFIAATQNSNDLNPIEHLWRDLKMAVHQRLPSNLTELERICKEEWQRIPKSRCEKLVASFPKRLMAVLNQKGASTKYWAKGLNT